MQLVGDPLFPLQSIAVFFKELQELLVPGILGGEGKGDGGREGSLSVCMVSGRSPGISTSVSQRLAAVFDHILELAHIPGPLVI